MKRLIILLSLLWLWAPGDVLAQDVDQPLVVPAGQHLAGSVATVSQAILIEGTVDGDVTSWSGAITIVGSVGGDVVSYAGQVTIMPSGRVAGHVLASGGELRVASGATVAGQAIRGASGDALASLLDLFAPMPGAGDSAIGRVLLGAVLGVLLVAFCLLYVAFWPRRTLIASTTLQQLPGRALGLGLLTTMALGLVLPPLAAVLVSSVVGLPVLLISLALMAAAYIYGLAVLAQWAGRRIWWLRAGSAFGPGDLTIVVAVMLALALAIIAVLQPLYGVAMFILLASPGLGAAILSRGGLALPLGVA